MRGVVDLWFVVGYGGGGCLYKGNDGDGGGRRRRVHEVLGIGSSLPMHANRSARNCRHALLAPACLKTGCLLRPAVCFCEIAHRSGFCWISKTGCLDRSGFFPFIFAVDFGTRGLTT